MLRFASVQKNMPQHTFSNAKRTFEKAFGSSQSLAGVAGLQTELTMSTALNNFTNGRNGHRPVQVRGRQRSSVQKRKLVKVWHVRMVNRVLAACAAGFLPVASYIGV